MHEGEAQAQPLLISQLNGVKDPVGGWNAGLLVKAVCACNRVTVQLPLQLPKKVFTFELISKPGHVGID